MAICDFANLDYMIAASRPRLDPVRLTVHTAWPGPKIGPLYPGFPAKNGTFSHFYIDLAGALFQHFDTDYCARADLDGNSSSISVETADNRTEDGLTVEQLATLTRLWEWVRAAHPTIPEQLATPADPRGLAGHRLGCVGNFGTFDPEDITTWSGVQSGLRWSTARGKICPGVGKLRQLPGIVNRAPAPVAPSPEQSERNQETMNLIKTTTPWGADAHALIHETLGARALTDIEAVSYSQMGGCATVAWDVYGLLVRQAWERRAEWLAALGRSVAETVEDATARILDATKASS